METVLEETKYLMKKYKIKANKNLGQNFLVDDQVLEDIAIGANITSDDLVIEIGPGLGSLTKILLEKAKKVISIELDKKMIQLLNDRFLLYKNFEIINDDVLRVDLNALIKDERKKDNSIKNVKIVANLPYYITTPIIMKLVESNLDIESITVMIQKEVAERLIAKPGTKDSGAITYTIYYYCETEKIREVENTCFIPAPDVMFNIIKSAFMQRRKTLLNSLTNVNVFKSKEEGLAILKKLNLREDVRAENLSLEDYAKLSNIFILQIVANNHKS